MEALVGKAAEILNLKIGDEFTSTHGLGDYGEIIKIVNLKLLYFGCILALLRSVNSYFIKSVWDIHKEHDHDHDEEHDHDHDEEHDHDHDEEHDHDHDEEHDHDHDEEHDHDHDEEHDHDHDEEHDHDHDEEHDHDHDEFARKWR